MLSAVVFHFYENGWFHPSKTSPTKDISNAITWAYPKCKSLNGSTQKISGPNVIKESRKHLNHVNNSPVSINILQEKACRMFFALIFLSTIRSITADFMAALGHTLPSGTTTFTSPPVGLDNILLGDGTRVPYLRQ
ncbi:hypothetical protein SLE2022_264560 [Rubroshorea leprosula]